MREPPFIPCRCRRRRGWLLVASMLGGLLPFGGLWAQSSAQAVPFYRFVVTYPHDEIKPGIAYNPNKTPLDFYHRYSRYKKDLDDVNMGRNQMIERWQSEGFAGYVLPEERGEGVPLYSLFKKLRPFDNFLTTNLEEAKAAIVKFNYEWAVARGGPLDDPEAGVAYAYIAAKQLPGTVPLYRLYKHSHFYTIDLAERDRTVAAGWTNEGVAGYVWAEPVCYPMPGECDQGGGNSSRPATGGASGPSGRTTGPNGSGGTSHTIPILIVLVVILVCSGAIGWALKRPGKK